MAEIRNEIVTITPAMAREFLATATTNFRRLTASTRQKYARDMAANAWQFTGDSIKFNTRGELVDGQHRLHACCDSDSPFTTLVVWGVEDAAVLVMDTVKPRRWSDYLAQADEPNAKYLASCVSLAWRYEKKTVHDGYAPTNSQSMQWLEANPHIRDVLPLSRRGQLLGLPPTALAVTLYEGAQLSSMALAMEFGESLINGANLPDDSPMLALRRSGARWRQGARAGTRNRHGSEGEVKFAIIIKAWNAHWAGVPVRRLKWSKQEEFPTISYSQTAAKTCGRTATSNEV